MATYVTARTVEEAVAALASGARPIAGGTDLVVGGRQGKKPLPESLVGIHRLAGLGSIEETPDGLILGALVTHAAIASNDLIRARYTRHRRRIGPRGIPRHQGQRHHRGQRDERFPSHGYRRSPAVPGSPGRAGRSRRISPRGPGRALDRSRDHQRPTGRASRIDSDTHPGRGNRELLRPPPIPSTDGNRGGRSRAAVTLRTGS